MSQLETDSPSLFPTRSVFDLGYIPTSKAVDYESLEACYFTLIDAPEFPTVEATSTDYFWKLIVTNLVEGHGETLSMHNTLSDSIGVFATGAKPVDVTISGKILVSETDDHCFEFFQEYVQRFRARQLAVSAKTLKFISKDTTFNLIIQSITVGAAVDSEGYFDLGIQGLAYGYKMLNSLEPMSYDYYGTTGSVSKSEALMTEEEVKQDTAQTPANEASTSEQIATAESSPDPEISVKLRETPSSTNTPWMANASMA